MAQLVIHNLEEEVQEAALGADASVGLGTRISRRFAGIGLDDDIPELRGNPPEPLKFEP